jgi:hypothetical protein
MYKETFPFENGWSHFHFTKRRFLFVLQNKEQGCPSAIFMAFGTAPLLCAAYNGVLGRWRRACLWNYDLAAKSAVGRRFLLVLRKTQLLTALSAVAYA